MVGNWQRRQPECHAERLAFDQIGTRVVLDTTFGDRNRLFATARGTTERQIVKRVRLQGTCSDGDIVSLVAVQVFRVSNRQAGVIAWEAQRGRLCRKPDISPSRLRR